MPGSAKSPKASGHFSILFPVLKYHPPDRAERHHQHQGGKHVDQRDIFDLADPETSGYGEDSSARHKIIKEFWGGQGNDQPGQKEQGQKDRQLGFPRTKPR